MKKKIFTEHFLLFYCLIIQFICCMLFVIISENELILKCQIHFDLIFKPVEISGFSFQKQ
ncbi:hypothetical protein HMPREF2936_00120 [Neisseria sp. HMSC064F04]|nr:hypothetical protein HMPREF2936_00120 [Neisseria sp. HMSC064F04]OHR40566.1 hypothetical protein HMPREF3025_08600 [Neisseria sp. HMSC070E12]